MTNLHKKIKIVPQKGNFTNFRNALPLLENNGTVAHQRVMTQFWVVHKTDRIETDRLFASRIKQPGNCGGNTAALSSL